MKKASRPLRKSPIWPALLSGLVAPGIGQIFNRDYAKGFFLLLTSMGSFFWFSKVLTERLTAILPGPPEQWASNQDVLREGLMKLINENSEMFLTFQILILLIWGFGVIDAYLTARKLIALKGNHENQNV
jgi:hypothetical protein